MKKHNLVILVLLSVLICAVSASAQHAEGNPINIGEPITSIELSPRDSTYLENHRGLSYDRQVYLVWLNVKGWNLDRFPNLDMVEPGDTLRVPLRHFCVADSVDTKHMWRAAELFVNVIMLPYLDGTLPTSSLMEVDSTGVDSAAGSKITAETGWSYADYLWWYIIGALVIIVAIILANMYLSRNRKRIEDSAKEEKSKLERNRKFIPDPPDFKTVGADQANRTATIAAQRAFGPGVTIEGDIERGHITGEQTMFNADGTSHTQSFSNEPGYRATVRFPDGHERQVVCRWRCFNPCYSCTDAEFTGYFRPTGSNAPEEIPRITSDQITALQQSISSTEQTLKAEDVPQSDVSETATPEEEAPDESDGSFQVTELRISKDKGVTVMGPNVRMTFNQLLLLTSVATGNKIPETTNKDSEESE